MIKYFLLKRKKDGKFISREGEFIRISDTEIRQGMWYPENEVLAWGKIWSSVFEFVPIIQQNGYWRFI